MKNEGEEGGRVRGVDVVDGDAVGGGVLGVVTSGLYRDPMAIYREYIQNAADSLEGAGRGDGRIEITLDSNEGWVRIRDNGPGVTLEDARRALVPIGRSEKKAGSDRGFRGIGRLAGVPFAEAVVFVTRAGDGMPVVRVVWDGRKLRQGVREGKAVGQIVGDSVRVETVGGGEYPSRFFEVNVRGIARYAAGSVMDVAAVRKFIGETCPVPFRYDFPYRRKIANLLGGGAGPFTLDVRIDGEEEAVTRPHRGVRDGEERGLGDVVELEEVEVGGLGGVDGAVGWIGHTEYGGAIGKGEGVRGVRARVGNMQIGGEGVFDHLFTEERFNRWCVAEVHVVDERIVPNARRDYFEPGPHLRNLENQLAAICRGIERRCRGASKGRLQRRRWAEFVKGAVDVLELAETGYLSRESAERVVAGRLEEASRWRAKIEEAGWNGPEHETLLETVAKLEGFRVGGDGRVFVGVAEGEVATYQKIFGALAEIAPTAVAARRTIEEILERVGVSGTGEGL